MSLSIIHTRAQLGVNAPLVTVETHLSNGLPSLSIVGLPEMAVRESKDRVRSALINSGFDFPTRRITINLAPADLPKQGGRYDLAIAMGILVASDQLPANSTSGYEYIGELALTGEIRPVFGVLPAAVACAKKAGVLFVAKENATEAALSNCEKILAASHLNEVCQHLTGTALLSPENFEHQPPSPVSLPNLSEVKGQFQARRALEIAAAGNHNLLFYGPPGTGKSMLASCLPSILPALEREDAVEVASIYSLAGISRIEQNIFVAPFRAPHHTASSVALVGGGSCPRPGEISLAHRGVLFLDELPEFGRKVLEVLREPIESGEIRISRAHSTITYPAQFQLVSAMNPCPCGFAGHPKIACTDTPQQISNYRKKLSGPLLDRFDLHVEVAYQAGAILLDTSIHSESSEKVYQRVQSAHDRQRFRQSKLNSELSPTELTQTCALTPRIQAMLENAMDRLALSARGAHRIIRVARTLADLDGSESIVENHLSEALAYRGLDRPARQI